MRERTEALRFSSTRLQNWKNFAQIEVALQNRVFLVGPNAAGKSNLLDVFRFLRDLASPGGGFQEAVRRRGGVSAIRCLAARRYPDIELRVVVEPPEAATRWEYELAFNQDAQRRAHIRRERLFRDGQPLLERPNDDDKQDPARLTQTHVEQVNVNRSFRELASFFESVRSLHIVPQFVREPDRGSYFLRLGNALSALYPKGSEEKRLLDAMLLAVPR